MFLAVLELTFILLFIIFMVSQVFMPLFMGVPMFPIFRKERKLREALEEECQKTVEHEIKEEIKDERGKRT